MRSLSNIVRLLRAEGDRSMLIWAALLAVLGLAPLATVYITRQIVDHVVAAAAAHGAWPAVEPLLLWAALSAIVMAAVAAARAALGWARVAQAERLKDRITARIHEQSARLDLAFYESPSFFDHLHRARDEATYRPSELLDTLGEVFQGCVTLAAMGAVLVAYGWWLPLALFLSAVPVLYVVGKHALIQQAWWRETTATERRGYYYDSVLTSAAHASELRLFDLGPLFRRAHEEIRRQLRCERLALVRRRGVAELLAAASGMLIASGAFGWVVLRTLRGAFSLGQLAAFYQAFAQGLSTMRGLLGAVAHLYASSLFLENLFEFLELQPEIRNAAAVHTTPAAARRIRFRDVTFSYPGSTRPALEHFDLEIPAGRTVALVGPNGGGKSTLLKLLCRLYDPAEGTIEIDDVDLRRIDLQELRALVTPLFQEPVRYSQSIANNISISALARRPSSGDIRRASELSGAAAFIRTLPAGYRTLLGKWFCDGMELSAGEWQRLALARAFLRPAPIMVLDEPTSALDPWSELDWFARFREVARGRTAIIITHRLKTAMHADVIHLIEHGTIAASGSHEELLERSATYAAVWGEQMPERRTPILATA